ncbi:MAG: hypothetical protein ACTSV3_04615 [Candidatus Thorarchaeota archaeon]|nr:MAG: hypothetical protein DRP09_01530 [Candidatus Thorarchaeota archaeon]
MEFREVDEHGNLERRKLRNELLKPGEREEIVAEIEPNLLTEEERKRIIRESIEQIDPLREKKNGHSSFEIRNRVQFQLVVQNHPEVQLHKSFERNKARAVAFFEGLKDGRDTAKPTLIEELEKLEARGLYKSEHGRLPDVRMESMHDVDRLLLRYPEERQKARFDEDYRHCQLYFVVRDEHGAKGKDLAEQYDVSHTFIGYCRNGIEPRLMKNLRKKEENRIIEKWIQANPSVESVRVISKGKRTESPDMKEPIIGIQSIRVRESVEDLWREPTLNPERVAEAVWYMIQDEVCEKHPIRYANINAIISREKSTTLEDFIHSHRRAIEDNLTQKLGLEHNRARIAYAEGRLYTWIPRDRSNELVGAYETEFYYFKDMGEIHRIVSEFRTRFGLENSLHESLEHINEILRQFQGGDGTTPARRRPIREQSSRLEGKVVRFYLDTTDRKLSDLQGNVMKVTGVNGQAGIESPRFPEGEELEILKARLAAIIVSDCHLRESGRITYYEEHIERIYRVQDILRNFGDIVLKPYLRPGSYEVHIPNQIGLMMIDEGMTPGNKTIENPHLPEGFLSWSEPARCAYLEELIPEDGHFDSKGYFSWSRQVALYINDESTEFSSGIGPDEIWLINEFGGHTQGLVEQNWISYKTLADLQENSDPRVAEIAANLVSTVDANRSNLVDDESRLARSLGINISVGPDLIRYYPAGKKVSARWKAVTESRQDSARWIRICPPNDRIKRNRAERWLKSYE